MVHHTVAGKKVKNAKKREQELKKILKIVGV